MKFFSFLFGKEEKQFFENRQQQQSPHTAFRAKEKKRTKNDKIITKATTTSGATKIAREHTRTQTNARTNTHTQHREGANDQVNECEKKSIELTNNNNNNNHSEMEWNKIAKKKWMDEREKKMEFVQ